MNGYSSNIGDKKFQDGNGNKLGAKSNLPQKNRNEIVDINSTSLCYTCSLQLQFCEICEGYFSFDAFERHFKKFHPNSNFLNDNNFYDGGNFGNKVYELNDIKEDNELIETNEVRNFDYKCPTCGRGFMKSKEEDFFNHIGICELEKEKSKLLCPSCKKVFSSSKNQEYEAHVYSCYMVECSYCKEKYTFNDIDNHEKECLKGKSKNNLANVYSYPNPLFLSPSLNYPSYEYLYYPGGSYKPYTPILPLPNNYQKHSGVQKNNVPSSVLPKHKPTESKNEKSEELKKEWDLYNSIYRDISKGLQEKCKTKFSELLFDYASFKNKHKFSTSYETFHSSSQVLKRLNNEFKNFRGNLPTEFNSSFFVRADRDNPHYIKFLIAGSRGTPYEHGLFLYDLYIPKDYPNTTPKCNLITTGNGNIRFNPNLYTNGYVCLSLLGTWSGKSTENWNPKESNLNQLLLSISSIVMNDKIIENEPGHEDETKYVNGMRNNEGYANIVRLGNMQYAMIDMLKNPIPEFKEVIHTYFKIKGKEIIEDMKLWIERAKVTEASYEGIAMQNLNWASALISNPSSFEKRIEVGIKELQLLLDKL